MLKTTFLNVSLAALGLLVGFILLEAGLRVVGISFPNFYRADPHRGFAHRPGVEGWWTREGKAFVRINRDGLRDREHSTAKPPGTVRVAILGDSYAQALQVPAEAAFWSVLERRLSDCSRFADQQVEVINFGVSSYGTAQELMTLRHHVWKYSPDIVVLAMFTGNDIQNNSKDLEWDATFRPFYVRPFYRLEADSLVLDESFLHDPWYLAEQGPKMRVFRFLLQHSRVLQVANAARQSMVARQTATQGTNGSGAELGTDDEIYRSPSDPRWEAAWAVTEALLAQMHHEVADRGSEFLVVTLSNGIQVHPNSAGREALQRQLGVADLFYPDRRIAAAGKRDGYRVVSLAPRFLPYAERTKTILHSFDGSGNGHWNASGHALAGREIASALCTLPERAGV